MADKSAACSHDCSSCGEDCAARRDPQSFRAEPNEHSRIGKVYGVVSGKGGVGKSLVTAMLAVSAARAGKRAAVLDADITGPSIPKLFGLSGQIVGSEYGMLPMETKTGIQVMSTNLILDSETAPVVWRGPVIAGVVKQFWQDVVWTDVDCMFVDMPPGTGDVPLTVFQSLPVDGIVVVTSPQELVGMIVEKAVNMAALMKIPVIGLVENLSYFECPACGGRHEIFGRSRVAELAEKFGIGRTCRIPVDPAIASFCDAGRVEELDAAWTKELSGLIF